MATSGDASWMGPLPAVPGCGCQVCRPEESYDEWDRRTIDCVLEHGWQVLLVAGDEAESAPAFAYTIGLGHRFGHPELLMSGLDHALMHRSLNHVARRIMGGLRLVPGDALENVLGRVPVAVEEVADDALGETVTWSGWFHRRKPEAVALVWPDTRGVFAWQPGAPGILDDRQPRRWRVPIAHTGGLATDPPWPFPVPPELPAFSCTHVVDDGEPVLWAAREADVQRGEDWSAHCGAPAHETADMRVVHLAHLVRSAPSIRALSGLGIDHEAWRPDPDVPWATAPLAR